MELSTLECALSVRGVATVALARPERGNACNPRMLGELMHQLEELASDPQARLLLLFGHGKHFCGGADFQDREPHPTLPPASFADIVGLLDGFPKPTLAVVQGGAIGAGAGLAVACDVTIADPDAFFSVPEVRFGRVPGAIAGVLIRAMGERNFRRYALSGERITAAEACRLGLAHQLVGASEREAVIESLIESLLRGAPIAQMETKRIAQRLRGEAGALPVRGEQASDAAEAQEGAAAFREKRNPSWYR